MADEIGKADSVPLAQERVRAMVELGDQQILTLLGLLAPGNVERETFEARVKAAVRWMVSSRRSTDASNPWRLRVCMATTPTRASTFLTRDRGQHDDQRSQHHAQCRGDPGGCNGAARTRDKREPSTRQTRQFTPCVWL